MKGFRKFILTTLAFAVLAILLMAIMWKVVTWTRAQLCHNPNATILVMGNSRIQYVFDDSKVNGAWNVGVNADNYNIIYWKLKTIHRYNPQIKKVVLEVDGALLFNYFKGVEYKLHPYYWDEMDLHDWLSLIEKDRILLMYPFDWMKITYPVKSILTPIPFKDLGIGCYTKLDRDKLQTELQAQKSSEEDLPTIPPVDELQLDYLNDIIAYCNDNHINLEFINMPSYPTPKVKYINGLIHQYITEKYPSVPFHDYELIELPDSCYGDISHINYKGANALSEIIKKDITE